MLDRVFLNFDDDEAIWNRRAPTTTKSGRNGSHRALGNGGSGRRTRDVIAAVVSVGSGKNGKSGRGEERRKVSRRRAAV